jgi:formylglycine-generating enzyme required for sulfatase activity
MKIRRKKITSMKKQHPIYALLTLGFLTVVLSLTGCKNTFIDSILGDDSRRKIPGPEPVYQVSIDTILNGTIVPKPASGTAGTEIILQTSPKPGYKLKSGSLIYQGPQGQVSIDETGRSFILPNGDVRIYAEFEALDPGDYSVSVLIGPTEHGIILARPEYGSKGTPVNLVVIPDPGYRCKAGSLKYDSTPIDDFERSFILPDQNVTVTAVFEELSGALYTVRSGNPAYGRIFPRPESGAGGTSIYLGVIPDPGYTLKSGSLKYQNGPEEKAVDEITRTFSLPAGHTTVNGEFAALPPGTYTVGCANLRNGHIIAKPGAAKAGDIVSLQVIPDPGFILKAATLEYTDAAGKHPIDNTRRKFTMPGNHVVVRAEFIPVPQGEFTVRVENSANGRILPQPEYGKPGTHIALMVIPDPGYRLKKDSLRYTGSSGGDTPINEQTTLFSLPGDHVTVRGEFEALGPGTYTVQTDHVPGGYITPMPSSGPSKTPIRLWVTPDPGYILKPQTLQYQVFPGTGLVPVNETTRTFELPAAHVRVLGEFEQAPQGSYTVRIEPIVNGVISAAPEHQKAGGIVSLLVTPDPEYRLKPGSLRYEGVKGAKETIGETSQFSMPGEHVTIYGEFEPMTYSVTIDPALAAGGSVTANAVKGPAKTLIILKISPKNGYRFVPGSLSYTPEGNAAVPIDEKTLQFSLPSANVTVSARFEVFTALKDMTVNGRTFPLTDGQTDYIIRIPGQESEALINFTVDKNAAVNPASGVNHSLVLFENPPVKYLVESPDRITKTTYTFTMIKELVPTEMVPSGSFQRDGIASNISVISRNFKIGKYEVTQEEWKQVMGYSRGEPGGKNQPVNRINWSEAIMFCNKLSMLEKKTPAYKVNGETDPQKWPANVDWSIEVQQDAGGYRLPTEMEWLWAAMGADYYKKGEINREGYAYDRAGKKLSSTTADVAWYTDRGYYISAPRAVGQKKPNELNLYDMSGNVAEWCWDFYNGKTSYDPSGTVTDYAGPASGSAKIARGGSYLSTATNIFFQFRGGGGYNSTVMPYDSPWAAVIRIGFRVISGE